jgi:hypothetical protein
MPTLSSSTQATYATMGTSMVTRYLKDDTAAATGVYVDNNQYYIIYPKDGAKKCECKIISDYSLCQTVCQDNTFSVPPGLGSLKGGQFSGLTKERS